MPRALSVLAWVSVVTAGSTARADEPADFIADARVFYRVVACAGTDPLPAGFDAKVVDAHCADLAKRSQRFKDRYVTPAGEFIATVRPASVPATVVYPFGGGDLGSALVAYPDAREITTISLEHPGDPTRLARLDSKELRRRLGVFRTVIGGLLANSDSASVNMRKLERGPIPGQLGFFIVELAILGLEPVSLRYFKLDEHGGVVYLTQAEVAATTTTAKRKKGGWVNTDYSEAFTNMELGFRKAGDPKAPLVIHRHLAANLANDMFTGSTLEKHLVAKGQVSAITKAASYLLWNSSFSGIRDYLLAHMAWMVSDSTGIPPRYATKAGFEQVGYGTFVGTFLAANAADNEAFRRLWKKSPRKKLGFRYGYYDVEKHHHLLITRPAATP
jgi:hypothetical protein